MKQSNTLINTIQTIRWTSEVYNMIDTEQDKFDARINEPKDLKLFIDFESIDIEAPKNQMEIPVIKYKTKKLLKQSITDLKQKTKPEISLF